jgi:hypothetical protein
MLYGSVIGSSALLINGQDSLSGAFARLRKATSIFVMFVLLSIRLSRMEQLGTHWTGFHEI